MSVLTLFFLATPVHSATDKPSAEAVKFFEERIRPLLVQRCEGCHGATKVKSGLRVDSLDALKRGGEHGPALNLAKPDDSLLLRVTGPGQPFAMPPKDKLSAREKNDLQIWVRMGAPWPSVGSPTRTQVETGKPLFTEKERAFWAFRKPVAPALPSVRNQAWIQSPIDAFILAALEARGLQPAAAVDKRTLIRRVTFDLIGLPPTPDEIDAFLNAKGPDAYARLVDRLLASPRYGERWGRHWLDVARYADSNGMDENLAYGNAWRYRDYIIGAFNSDKPYDQMIVEQLAGDLLPAATDPKVARERLIATGFLCLGPKMLAEDDPVKMQMDIIDEQIDTIGRTFLGLTLGCARCHDHKFDPIPMADYYSLVGIFKSTRTMENHSVVARWQERSLAPADETARAKAHQERINEAKSRLNTEREAILKAAVAEVRQKRKAYAEATTSLRQSQPKVRLVTGSAASAAAIVKTAEQWAQEKGLRLEILKAITAYLERRQKTAAVDWDEVFSDPQGPFVGTQRAAALVAGPKALELRALRERVGELEKAAPKLPEAMAVSEGTIGNARVHLRGNHLTLGAEVPRQFPRILAGERQTPVEGKRSGRLELARWVASADNPLTARVMVNRVWRWHFGAGLVRSTDNFGRLGERPDNTALLDFLALRFVQSGWSVKALHRVIVLSSAYQMGTGVNDRALAVDPENRLLWRRERHRLEAEVLRDALLGVSGQLDLTMGGSILTTKNRAYVASTTSVNATNYQSSRRSIYLPVVRSALYEVFQAFDFVEPSVPSGDRATTTVAPQALFMMNGELVHQAARKLAVLIAGTDADRVRMSYLRLYGRPAAPPEVARALAFVRRVEKTLEAEKIPAAERTAKAWQSLYRALLAANEFIYVD